ncbi:hypothetical protein BJ912DRAFT_929877 [Pholiota molesta]|nr:hypothetical protein BJ912DRAFT_929877 [Pholiota molesta]
MALNILKSFLPATNPDVEMSSMEPHSRTASASESIPRPISPHSDMELYVEGNAAMPEIPAPAIQPSSHPPLAGPSISQTQHPITLGVEAQTAPAIQPLSRPSVVQFHPLASPNMYQAQPARQPAGIFPASRIRPPTNAPFRFGNMPESSTNQPPPLLPAAEIVPSTYAGKKHPMETEPSKVRIVRQLSFEAQENLMDKIKQKHDEFDEKKKEVEAELEKGRAAVEERQREVEQRLQEARELAAGEAEKRRLAEAEREKERVEYAAAEKRRTEQEDRLNEQLAKAVEFAANLQKEAENARNQAAQQILQLQESSAKMANRLEEIMAKFSGGSIAFPTDVQAQVEPGPMDLYTENTDTNMFTSPSTTQIATTWQAGPPDASSEYRGDSFQPSTIPDPAQQIARRSSDSRRRGKAPVRDREYDGDVEEDEDDEDMEDIHASMQRGVSESPGPSESDNEESARRANTAAQERLNVPKPRNFGPPRGGGHSSGEAQMLMSNPPAQQPSLHPTPINRFRTRTNQSWLNGLATYYGQDATPNDDTTLPRKRTKAIRRVFRKTALKGFNPVEATKKTGVRRAMNELLGIEKDVDMNSKVSATEQEFYRYQDEGIGEPALNPMRPYFLKGGFNAWNDCLCEKFTDYYERSLGVPLTEQQKLDVEFHFMERINRLGRAWRKSRTRSQEETIIAERNALARSRANSRRMTLYDDRREIAASNMKNRDGTVHKGWESLYNMVEKMGPSGMSSDESEAEGKRTVYIIKKRPWRSEEVQRYLILIDNDRNTTGSAGGNRPGNPPRERRRRMDRQSVVSNRQASVGCPINYYERYWYEGLSNRAVSQLGAKAEEVFPGIAEEFEVADWNLESELSNMRYMTTTIRDTYRHTVHSAGPK